MPLGPQDVKEETKLGMIFDAYDDDHSGTLEAEELVKLMTGEDSRPSKIIPYRHLTLIFFF